MRDQCYDMKDFRDPAMYTEVVIVGNGPGGLAASYVLSGHHPIYNGLGHPDPMLSARLSSSVPKCESILTTERIRFLSQGMEEFGGTSSVGTLFDSLLRPGILSSMRKDSPLSWQKRGHCVDHVVLGDGPPGGIWQRLDPDLLTLSLNSWMELPGLRMSPKFDHKTSSARRATAREVADYYVRYTREKGLCRFQRDCRVISVKHLDKISGERARWEVKAVDKNGNQIVYRSRFCILACGSSVPRWLRVDGEYEDNVVHDLAGLESRLSQYTRSEPCRVLVVGAGLSAADAVLLARFKGCEIAHSFRAEDVTLGQMLPESLYPEYHKVREMMRSSSGGYPGYTSFPGTAVTSLVGRTASLESASHSGRCGGKPSARSVDFDVAAVFIGSSADLSFLADFKSGLQLTENEEHCDVDPKANPVSVDPWSYEVKRAADSGLYAIGSLVGDIYVRYIPGGAIAASAHIIQQIEESGTK